MKRKPKAVKELESEKAELAEKTKNMAEIIERLSSEYQEPPKVPEALQKRLNDLDEKIEARNQALKENIENLEKAVKKSKTKEELIGLSAEIKENMGPRFEKIEKQMSNIDKINALEEKMNTLIEKLEPKKKTSAEEQVKEQLDQNNQQFSPNQIYNPVPGQAARIAISDMAVLKNDIDDTKKSIKIIAASISDMKDEFTNNMQDTNTKIKEIRNLKDLTDISKKEIDVIEKERSRLYETVETIEKRLMKRIENIEKNQESLYRIFDDQVDYIRENTLRKDWVKDHKKEERDELESIKNDFSRQLDNFRKESDKIHDIILQLNSHIDHANEKINRLDTSTVKQKWIEEHDKNEDEKIKKIENSLKVALEKTNEKLLNQIEEIIKEAKVFHDKQLNFENNLQKIRERLESDDQWKKDLEKEDKNLRNSVNERFEEIRSQTRSLTKDLEVSKESLKDSMTYLQNQIKTIGENTTVFKDDIKTENEKIHERLLKMDSNLLNMINEVNRLNENAVKVAWAKEHDKKEKELLKAMEEDYKKSLKTTKEDLREHMKAFKKDQSEKADARADKLEKNITKLYDNSVDKRWAENYEKLQNISIQKIREEIGQIKGNIDSLEGEIKVSGENMGQAGTKLHERMMTVESYIKNLEKRMNEFGGSSVKNIAMAEYVKAQKETIQRIEDKFEKKILELERLIVGVRNSYDSILKQTITGKKEAESTATRQKERINTLLKELSV